MEVNIQERGLGFSSPNPFDRPLRMMFDVCEHLVSSSVPFLFILYRTGFLVSTKSCPVFCEHSLAPFAWVKKKNKLCRCLAWSLYNVFPVPLGQFTPVTLWQREGLGKQMPISLLQTVVSILTVHATTGNQPLIMIDLICCPE